MKKFLPFTILLILSVLVLTACGGTSNSPDYAPYWGQKDAYEHSEFDISVAPLVVNEKATNEKVYKLDPAYSSGTYKTTLEVVLENGNHTGTYKVQNEFSFTGKYNKNGNLTDEFTDSYTSEATFKVSSGSFTTLSSSKTATFTHVCDKDSKTKTSMHTCSEDGVLNTVSYKITTNYSNKKVSSSITVTKDDAGILSDVKKTFNGNLNQKVYFDNDSLFYGIRSLIPNEQFSLTFNLIDPLESKVLKMQSNYVSKEDKKIKLSSGATIDGVATDELECNLIETIIADTVNKGAPINLYYAKDRKVNYLLVNGNIVNVEYYMLAKVEHGDMIYTLKEFTNNSAKPVKA